MPSQFVHGQVAHFAINADDIPRAQRFYKNVFGWKFTPYGPPGFFMIENKPSGELRGALQQRREIVKGVPMRGLECCYFFRTLKATSSARCNTTIRRIEGKLDVCGQFTMCESGGAGRRFLRPAIGNRTQTANNDRPHHKPASRSSSPLPFLRKRSRPEIWSTSPALSSIYLEIRCKAPRSFTPVVQCPSPTPKADLKSTRTRPRSSFASPDSEASSSGQTARTYRGSPSNSSKRGCRFPPVRAAI
jgi:predicted enzyme related to lactoylglutathione lyase